MSYRLTSKAVDDITHIFLEGVLLFGAAQAEKYHLGMEEAFQLLSRNPELAGERDEIDPPVRIHPYGAHLIVYVVEQGGDVLIVRVRHGREDWQEQR